MVDFNILDLKVEECVEEKPDIKEVFPGPNTILWPEIDLIKNPMERLPVGRLVKGGDRIDVVFVKVYGRDDISFRFMANDGEWKIIKESCGVANPFVQVALEWLVRQKS